MISNKTITEKLEQKTVNSPAIKEFLIKALELESEGKYYKKPFTSWIKQGIKAEKDGGKNEI